MKKAIKIIGRIILILLAILLIFTLVTFICHCAKTNKELELLKEKGYYNPVSVGDYSLNVAEFGGKNSSHTIVAMAGLGMGNFSITERQMTAVLEKDNLVVFIDRAGYGLSEDTDNDMTVDYIVEDYRKALKNAGLEAPYILMPHSIGGAYANCWLSKYPDEIEAVVFIDGTQLSDEVFDNNSNETVGFSDYFASLVAKLGFYRYIHDDYALLPDNYSEEEQQLHDALQLRTSYSIAFSSESYLHDRNLQEAWSGIIINDVPKLYICSSWGAQTKEELTEYLKWFSRLKERNHIDSSTNLSEISDEIIQEQLVTFDKLRKDNLYPYAEKMGNCEVAFLPGDHAIYEQKPEECGKLIKDFVDGLNN